MTIIAVIGLLVDSLAGLPVRSEQAAIGLCRPDHYQLYRHGPGGGIAMKNGPWESFLDGIGNGLGYGFILVVVV